MTLEPNRSRIPVRVYGTQTFHDGNSLVPPEKLLQLVWLHQRIRTELHLVDGRRVRVLHPGYWNREAGPDFRNAMIQIADEIPLTGDVELDLRTGGWKAHRHEGNPRYIHVVLHVVWKASGLCPLPTLELEPHLDTSLGDLQRWSPPTALGGWPPHAAGQCRMPLQSLSDIEQAALLRSAAEIRFRLKVSRLSQCCNARGPLPAFWGQVFRALGYKQNPAPMQYLGEAIPRSLHPDDTPVVLQARLLGMSGLLSHDPSPTSGSAGDYHRRLREIWRTEIRDAFRNSVLPRTAWRMNQVRPANRPERRLALASYWLCDPSLFARLEEWSNQLDRPIREVENLFDQVLGVPADPFWSFHWTLRSRCFETAKPLLGRARATDLAMNVLLPWLSWKAEQEGNTAKAESILKCYLAWPAAQDNAVLRRARQRLLRGEISRCLLRKAAAQQGLLQIVRDYCEHSNSLCEHCPFPDEIRSQLKSD